MATFVGFVERNDLRDVTLVAHSYAAAPVTGAAGCLGERLERVVYVDSAPFSAGMCMLDLMPPEAADQLRHQVAASGDGWRLPMLAFLNQPPWRRFALPTRHWPMLSAPAELAGILDAALS